VTTSFNPIFNENLFLTEILLLFLACSGKTLDGVLDKIWVYDSFAVGLSNTELFQNKSFHTIF